MEISAQTWEFIRKHRNGDVRDLALHAHRDDAVDLTFALDQIDGWQRARTKLPEWAAHDGVIYPPHISMEQCSSQSTARYKAGVAARLVGTSAGSESVSASMSHDGNASTIAEPATPPTANATSTTQTVDGEAATPRGTLVDLTGGFGVDFSYMARGFRRGVYVERQPHLCEIAEHNMHALGLDHVTVVNGNAEEYLTELPDRVTGDTENGPAGNTMGKAADGPTGDMADGSVNGSTNGTVNAPSGPTLIFLDPARRDTHGARTYAIANCTPDVLALKDMLLAKADWVMVKLSPMLDWRKTVADLGDCVREVHIVSTGNECKELLVVMSTRTLRESDDNADNTTAEPHDNTSSDGSIRMVCVNDDDVLDYRIGTDGKVLESTDTTADGDTDDAENTISDAGNNADGNAEPAYLYEPNASIMKAGCFDLLERRYARYGLRQIGPNSHLFVSGSMIERFPGRAFEIDAVTGMGKKELRAALDGITQANIAVRNFPMPVAALRKKLKLKDGGDAYIFATTTAKGRHVLMVTRKTR
ncbi:THUMP-like domain-containing protein [Bifidobacterium callimiconis]|uniref:DNA methyltransferase n=1 Tax=Bifidobacterium callimiconis TaxID=2306973 RepID=A0A430FDH9_9BIFI|nr:SAM-dependent methyltransferase [Bifidobacterium callimiconis]RSX50848.1 DNA methyltransferase [Bifidobacterium callimiconis]